MGLTEAHEPAPPLAPDPVRATFDTWLDHVLACDQCRRAPTRHCYDSARLGDRHREATAAASRGRRL